MSYLSNYAIWQEKHLGTLNDVWVRLEYDRYRSLKPTDIVVDAGASIGAFTVKACLQAQFVYAFEPELENFQMLQKNTEKHMNVKIFQKALWNSSGKKPLYLSRNWGGHSLIPKQENRTIEVETLTLDEAVTGRVDFLKVDVEATELELFQGARTLLKKHKPFITIEIHSIPIFQSVKDFLSEFGYTVRGGIIDSTIVEIREPTYGTVYFA